jgi:hypothetical protein
VGGDDVSAADAAARLPSKCPTCGSENPTTYPEQGERTMNECGGSHPNYECSRAVFWTNPSGHKFCREHAIMHEAQLAGGFAQRIAEAGDAYLVGAVVEAVANLTAFVDRWPDHDRMTDR